VGKRENELVDYTVDAYGSGNEGKGGVGWVAEDEVVRVERRQSLLAYASAGGWSVSTCNADIGGWWLRDTYVIVGMWLTYG